MRRLMHGDVPLTYSELLRVVGQYLDRSNLFEIRILETDEGLILQGLVMDGPKAGERMTYQITPEDIEELFHDEYARRGNKT